MGGKALKKAVTRRYQKDEFKTVTNELYRALAPAREIAAMSLVRAYSTKATFGDADFLVATSVDAKDIAKLVRRLFSPAELVINETVISFDYKELQVDLILSPPGEYLFASNYFAFNDLGNFIGRTANRLGFKFGHNGLFYRYYDPENPALMFREILVTDHFTSALRFLGYDSRPYSDSKDFFRTPEDIYKYAATSEYFDPATYLLENRASEGRRRDKTRTMYQGMLRFLHQTCPGLESDPSLKPIDRELHLRRAITAFPEFKQSLYDTERELAEKKAFKRVFCGEVYTEALGVTGRDLGEVMVRHRLYFDTHNINHYISTLTVDTFIALIRALERNDDTL